MITLKSQPPEPRRHKLDAGFVLLTRPPTFGEASAQLVSDSPEDRLAAALAVACGWEDVVDEDGNAVEFSMEMLQRLCAQDRQVMTQVYLACISEFDRAETAAKN